MFVCVYADRWWWGLRVYMKVQGWCWESSSIMNLLKLGLSVEPKLTNLTSLAIQLLWKSSVSAFQVLALQADYPCPCMYVGFGDPNFNPHVCCFSGRWFNHWASSSAPGSFDDKLHDNENVSCLSTCLLDILCFLLRNIYSKIRAFNQVAFCCWIVGHHTCFGY